tara:strand:- start:4816 stop:5619 length:804 start_codon:yes stop_codon:yes gene_type:complete
MFPKIIHLIYWNFQDNKPMPKKWLENYNKWKKLNPIHIVKLWNYDDCLNLLKTKYPFFVKYYLNYKYHIQRVDSIRYFILYEYGGIYTDLDIEPLYPLDTLLNLYENDNKINLLLSESSQSIYWNGISNYFIISKSKINFWKLVFKELIKKNNSNYFLKSLTVFKTTGPFFLGNIYKKNKKNIYIIPLKILGDCDVCKVCNKNHFKFFINKNDNSWGNKDSKLFMILYCHKYEIKIIIITIIIMIITNHIYKIKKYCNFNNKYLNFI